MTSNALRHRTEPARQEENTGPVATAALVGLLSSTAFIVGIVFLGDQSARESTLSPYSLAVNVLTTLAFAGLAFTIPSLSRVVDAPRWVIHTCAAACAAVAAMSWSLVTIAPHLAKQVSDDEFMEFTMYLSLFPAPKMLLILAGVLSLWWAYPPATIFAGLAFAWIAKSVDAGSRE